MRKAPNPLLEKHRVIEWELDRFNHTFVGENNGAFIFKRNGVLLHAISSTGKGWEHVSVSTQTRTPTWDEMQFIKELFWKDEETCIQYHPAKSAYINCHPYTLHIWRCPRAKIPVPPRSFV